MKILDKEYKNLDEVEIEYNEMKLEFQNNVTILTQMRLVDNGAKAHSDFNEKRTKIKNANKKIQERVRLLKQAMKRSRKGEDISGVAMGVRRLIDKYEAFGSDYTRIRSMQIMANEIASELRGVLRESKLIDLQEDD